MATKISPLDPPRLQFRPEDSGRTVTSEDFAAAEFVGPSKYERVKGRLFVMAPDGQQHHDSSRPWRRLLGAYWIDHPELVEDLVMGAWLRIDGSTDRIGDIGIYLRTQAKPLAIPDRVPELMFEIISPGQESHDRDYLAKRADYEKRGVREYVIIDPIARKVTVLTLSPPGYVEEVLTATATYTTPLLPGLAIPLAGVFGE
jgi:Uma2 family endonuclease